MNIEMQRSTVPLFCILLGILPAAVGFDAFAARTAEQYIESAIAFEQNGDIRASVIQLKNAAAQSPGDGHIRVLLGKALLNLGAGIEAEKELTKAIALGVDDAEVDVALGEALLLRGEYQRALAEVDASDSMPPGERAAILRIHGQAKLGLKQVDEACELFARAVEIDERQIEAHWGLASCASAIGSKDEAQRQLEHAVELEPTNAETWLLIGDLARANNDFAEAERAYTEAFTIAPNSSTALAKRALTRLGQPQNTGALEDLARLREIAPQGPATLYLEALTLYTAGEFAQALAKIQQVPEETSIQREVDRLTGFIHYRLGNLEQAERHLSRYLAQANGDMDARKALAATYLQTGRAGRALDMLSPALDSDDVDVLSMSSAAHLEQGDPAAAAVLLQRAVVLAPESFALNSELGIALLASGHAQQAQVALERAATLETSADQRYRPTAALAQALIQQQQFEKALAAAASLEALDPHNALGPTIQGAAYLGLDDLAGARKSFERALELQPGSAPAALNLVQVDLREGHPKEAQRRLEGVLSVDPGNVQAMLGLAGLSAESGEEHGYVDWLKKAVAVEPPALQPRLLLAQHYLRTDRAAKALAVLRGARAAFPRDTQVLALLTDTQLRIGETEDAVMSARQALNAAPNSPMRHYKLAAALLQLGDTEGYRSSLSAALALIPSEVAAGRYEDAMKIAEELESLYPESPLGTALLGDVYMAQGQFVAALEAYERAWRRQQSGALAVKLDQARRGSGNDDAADPRLAEWIDAHPEEVVARLYQAGILESRGRRQEAIAQYQAVLQQQPRQVTALNNLALLYLAEGDPRALSTAEDAYEAGSANLAVADTLGWILLQNGQIDRGAEMIRRAAPLAERNSEIRYHLAVASAKTGHTADARKQLLALLADDRPFAQRAAAEALLESLGNPGDP